MADGLPPANASLVRLAADGLWLTELLDLAPLDEDLRSSVRDELLAHLDSSLERTGRGGSKARDDDDTGRLSAGGANRERRLTASARPGSFTAPTRDRRAVSLEFRRVGGGRPGCRSSRSTFASWARRLPLSEW